MAIGSTSSTSESPARDSLPRPRYFVYDRSTVNQVEIFREENIPLITETIKLSQKYQVICRGTDSAL
jgi:hypothetical protein